MTPKQPARVTPFRRGGRPRLAVPDDGPGEVLPFRRRRDRRTFGNPPTSATIRAGQWTKRRTWTPGVSMTLSIDVNELARALVSAGAQHDDDTGGLPTRWPRR